MMIIKEQLISEIKERIALQKDLLKRAEDSSRIEGSIDALLGLLNSIDSLQQEQPDCHTVEDWIQHIKNADQLTKDIFSKGPYDVLYDALNHPYQHCYDAIKEFGELCFQTGVDSVKQEQLSLPDNLDEIAEEWAENEAYGKSDAEFEMAYKGFKAGAQWMKDRINKKINGKDNRRIS